VETSAAGTLPPNQAPTQAETPMLSLLTGTASKLGSRRTASKTGADRLSGYKVNASVFQSLDNDRDSFLFHGFKLPFSVPETNQGSFDWPKRRRPMLSGFSMVSELRIVAPLSHPARRVVETLIRSCRSDIARAGASRKWRTRVTEWF
jgi:hypothetical protein